MTGGVDDYGRATVPVRVKHSIADTEITVEAWIDTGFTDALMLTAEQIATIGLSPASTVTAGFAHGSEVELRTYSCRIDWFGSLRAQEAIVCSGRHALIGVGLLEDLVLTIDYPARSVRLEPSTRP